jgi:hypothetical protein
MINRKAFFVGLLFLILEIPAFVANGAETFGRGSVVINMQGNVGIMDTPDDYKLGYGGRLSFEFGVANLFGEKGALGLAIVASDLYGGTFESMNAGSYNYSYTSTTYTREKGGVMGQRYVIISTTSSHKRKGDCVAECDVTRNDATLMAGISMHYEFADHLDTYMMIGGGATYCTRSFSNYHNEVNLEIVDHIRDKPHVDDYHGIEISYYYNDYKHVKWKGFDPKFYPAAMALIGTRYYFCDHFAVNVEAGVNTFTIKKNINAMTLGSVGFSYKF